MATVHDSDSHHESQQYSSTKVAQLVIEALGV